MMDWMHKSQEQKLFLIDDLLEEELVKQAR